MYLIDPVSILFYIVPFYFFFTLQHYDIFCILKGRMLLEFFLCLIMLCAKLLLPQKTLLLESIHGFWLFPGSTCFHFFLLKNI